MLIFEQGFFLERSTLTFRAARGFLDYLRVIYYTPGFANSVPIPTSSLKVNCNTFLFTALASSPSFLKRTLFYWPPEKFLPNWLRSYQKRLENNHGKKKSEKWGVQLYLRLLLDAKMCSEIGSKNTRKI